MFRSDKTPKRREKAPSHVQIELEPVEAALEAFSLVGIREFEHTMLTVNQAINGLEFMHHGETISHACFNLSHKLYGVNESGEIILIPPGDIPGFLKTMQHPTPGHVAMDLPEVPKAHVRAKQPQKAMPDEPEASVLVAQQASEAQVERIDQLNRYLKGKVFNYGHSVVRFAYMNYKMMLSALDESDRLVIIPPQFIPELYSGVIEPVVSHDAKTTVAAPQEAEPPAPTHDTYHEYRTLPDEGVAAPSVEARDESTLEVRLPSIPYNENSETLDTEEIVKRLASWDTQFRHNVERTLRRVYPQKELVILDYESLKGRPGFDEYEVTVRFGGSARRQDIGSPGVDILKIKVRGVLMDAG